MVANNLRVNVMKSYYNFDKKILEKHIKSNPYKYSPSFYTILPTFHD